MARLPTTDLDYALPAERIAQRPLEARDASLLLHLPAAGGLEDRAVRDLPALLRGGDLLVVNDTRVRAARLRGRREGGGEAELLVLRRLDDGSHACLVRPGRRLPSGTSVVVSPRLRATVGPPLPGATGARSVRLEADDGDVDAAVEAAGTVPLPPYIRTRLEDPERYQTVYSRVAPAESAAAPTAGLHLSAAVLDALEAAGIAIARVRLEVGLATFAPIRVADAADHVMHAERYRVPEETAAAVDAARRRGGRVVAVGTTTVRTLETVATGDGGVRPGAGETGLFLHPGVPLTVVDGLLTNFHQPRSSLLLLVDALVGAERRRAAYAHALAGRYRFLSFGDCMLAWRPQR